MFKHALASNGFFEYSRVTEKRITAGEYDKLFGTLTVRKWPTTLHCDALSAASHSPSFCASVWTTGLAGPRKIVVTPAGTVLVLDTPALGGDDGRVVAVWDADNDGYSDES